MNRSQLLHHAAPAICAAVLVILLIFTVHGASAGGYIPESAVNISNHSYANDIENRLDAVVADICSEAGGEPKLYPLPLDDSPAPVPDADNYSTYVDDDGIEHLTYSDATISVDYWKYTQVFEGEQSVINAAHVRIAHPTQLRTAFAGGEYSLTDRDATSLMAKENNAVIAINADMYNYSTEGVIIRQGRLYNNLTTDWDILFIDENGDFIIMPGREAFAEQFYVDHTVVYNSFVFGPALIIDGEIQSHKRGNANVRNNAFGVNPRTAIGQLGELEYMLVVVDGRSDESYGVKIDALAQIMKDLGCTQAYNLDGGQSSAMVMNNTVVSVPSNGGERSVSEIIYFATGITAE